MNFYLSTIYVLAFSIENGRDTINVMSYNSYWYMAVRKIQVMVEEPWWALSEPKAYLQDPKVNANSRAEWADLISLAQIYTVIYISAYVQTLSHRLNYMVQLPYNQLFLQFFFFFCSLFVSFFFKVTQTSILHHNFNLN